MTLARPEQLVLASHNQGKIKELQLLLEPLSINVLGLAELGLPAPEETGLSFVENAILKARAASQASGLPALADDSGLVVPALKGEPGIYSARYAGPEANDQRNYQLLLERMAGFTGIERQAYFVCALAYVQHGQDPLPWLGQGQWPGEIVPPQGESGFGYDPVFYLPELQQTAAQLDKVQKAKLSHRGRAMEQLLAAWQSA